VRCTTQPFSQKFCGEKLTTIQEAKMAAKANKISQQELIEMVRDIDVSDDEIAKYFVIDEQSSEAFAPRVIPNADLVEDIGLEGAFAINAFNSLARARRNRKYRRRIKDWDGVRIVAEGDSWFQYPLMLKDTIDQLIDTDNFQYAIYGLSKAGDLLANIVQEDEISEALHRENPDVFLISGGGNDMVGDGRLATMVHKFTENRKAKDYPNVKFDDFLSELERLYRRLFTRILTDFPHLKIVCHGYDNAIPQKGPWLGKPLIQQGITGKTLQKQVVAVMIGRFNDRLKSVVNDFPGSAYHVDCQKLIGTASKWHDELHPKNDGYFKVAQEFDAVIKKALSDESSSKSIGLKVGVESSATDQQVALANVQKLDNQEFLNLVVSRARTIFEKPVQTPTSKYERKQLEKDISDHFEKVHKEANFLPSSFLENGVARAHSVCRIVTDTSYGSGFLIASRNFIMTNNHVIPDIETARSSVAEFDYDEDNVEYDVSFKPDVFFLTDQDLDFTIIACDPSPLPDEIEAIPLLRDIDTVTRGERVNIVQHPKGRRKEISLHDNKVNYVYDVGIRYTADTEGGSSGSPVFNNQWNLVALHHAGWSDTAGTATNEGMRIAAIVDFLVARNNSESSAILDGLVESISERGFVDDNANTVAQPAGLSSTKPPTTSAKSGKSLTLNIEADVDELTIKLS